MTIQQLLALLNDAAQLEPVAFGLVMALVDKLKGKSDAEVLAADATDWSSIVFTAHEEAQEKQS